MSLRDLYRSNMEMEYMNMLKESNREMRGGKLERSQDLDIRANRILQKLKREEEDHRRQEEDYDADLDFERTRARWRAEDREIERAAAARKARALREFWTKKDWKTAHTEEGGYTYTSLFHLTYQGLLLCDPEIIFTPDLVIYDLDSSGVNSRGSFEAYINSLKKSTYLPFCDDCRDIVFYRLPLW